MTAEGLLQILLYLGLLAAVTPLLGRYMARVFEGERTLPGIVLGPLERGLYRIAGIDPAREQHWTGYTLALLSFNLLGLLLLYALLRFQALLPLNPAELGPVGPDLAFNTAVSFTTNTNWQSYGGETTLSYLSQMLGLTVQNFVSAATGIAVAVALIRGFARRAGKTVGNFWADLVRATLYVLLPLAFLGALVLVWQGVPQNFDAYVTATTLEGGNQVLAQGPAASQIAIKQLGSNGGGFFNVNSAHPYENPTALTNLLESFYLLMIAAALIYSFGRMVGDTRQGRALWTAVFILFVAGLAVTWWAEAQGNPAVTALGVETTDGNMEGKEVRYGTALSALWAVATTAASNGSVNAMHDSFMPLGGMVPMLNMMLGEVIYGGVGAGLYGLLVFVILAVFIAGLMVGRTPEYLGKKIEAREIKLAVIAVLVFPLGILGGAALTTVVPQMLASVQDPGPHGLSEILYAYTSATGNNGSAFAGFGANTPWHNTGLGLAMLLGRFAVIVPTLAIAGSLVAKRAAPAGPGTLPTHGTLFITLLIATILIVGGLTFFPALALGPIAEHLSLTAGTLFGAVP
ncbi:potassium-transporting ATPase subunit KdpA [Rhodospirillum centenum]|uniref:Potassium-transporting ATPase potassium-binding subunit n=1 Tax=Rhodospirillum centenum (strain ATCC 51521 / SW) TaxID=414684 RepID=KDPA_RHOCS|nr:potassium-transporting ATPase subunit KdpA [Rhodospirillum centenum]B6IQY9.1 RecName: Full=Potassium-transporting ATPase potassium-binding subunit; AltName: Full=ATP phosphohydrolase [potassium-transporting] A chain; AltName: Full=Potassium-binding and translocating subunit A; AltName: Full=Potassium-translocating ATPase A chain [Rhodospirillum centenum SW]ACI97875.1 potassium-transporting ATPase A chain [Rhodospirillum centenum SW]